MQLTTTKEKVLEAVEKDPQAKETLKTLFPEVFKCDTLKSMADKREMQLFNPKASGQDTMIGVWGHNPDGTNKFHLSGYFDWKIEGNQLIPTPKI